MATYTTSAKVAIHLPDDVPAAVSARVDDDITDASAIVDGAAGSRFPLSYGGSVQRFPDITDSPATPALIELCARWYAASFQWARMGQSAVDGEQTEAEKFEKKAEALLERIRNGEVAVTIDGADPGSSALEAVQDEIYDATGEPVFNTDDMNGHLY